DPGRPGHRDVGGPAGGRRPGGRRAAGYGRPRGVLARAGPADQGPTRRTAGARPAPRGGRGGRAMTGPAPVLLAAEEQSGLMGNPLVVLVATLGIITASAFFVAVELSLISAHQHLIVDVATHSRGSRAALRN